MWLSLLAIALVPSVGLAQGVSQPMQGPATSFEPAAPPAEANVPVREGERGPNSAWGTQNGVRWIPAVQFTGRLTSTAPALTYYGPHFYYAPGVAGTARYFAPLDLEPGLYVYQIWCLYYDDSTTNNLRFSLQKGISNYSTGSASYTENGVTSTSGATAGVQAIMLSGLTPFTYRVYDGNFTTWAYYLTADVAADTSFAGCRVWYNRQVAPGPATATFTDVPTSSPYFKYVEAFYASGVIAGCGGGNYCPNAGVTRGQLAIFLGATLGMGYPW
jgi:hypothetical protein